ncbi:hypothetical protein OO006_06410 [Prosthecochloris sp. SCSIO W1101]|uniref:hypothetical protein n=1 Tax=Prosthecochloris sp. SCSIO W1101 TaxID=2992242 RepID=UPI00223E627F|nr:hypothetical protein [Prosthecochloris sp. SCSIO W1101]UZJ42577.1 hypothetical protein OO006_06410 [Prosthecochloris sp. SCSIO W1101]
MIIEKRPYKLCICLWNIDQGFSCQKYGTVLFSTLNTENTMWGTITGGTLGAVYGAAKSTVNNALKSSENAVGEMKDMASDPAGYIENKLDNLSFSSIPGAVSCGLDKALEGLARETGIGHLVDGLVAFVDSVVEICEQILQMIKCTTWLENPTFWSAVSIIYAGRVKRLLKSREDCERFVRGAEFVRAIDDSIVSSMNFLSCAIDTAFLALSRQTKEEIQTTPRVSELKPPNFFHPHH